jgi:uncharacterized repeat protein (TIGR03806 family)
MRSGSPLARFLLLAALLAACGGDGAPETLAGWALFDDAAGTVPAAGVIPYDVNAALFMDDASKHRYVRVPDGMTIGYRDDGVWEFPEGTALVKSFGYLADMRDPSLGERLLETRLLVLEGGEWVSYIYRWNDAQTEATRVRGGARVPVTWIDEDGAMQSLTYRVPNEAQCEGCHGDQDPVHPLGPKTAQLDRLHDYGALPVNQIDHFASLGLLDRAPPPEADRVRFPEPFGDDPDLDRRARAYLDANCAHCHRDGGSAESSGFWLGAHITDPIALGVCRRPVAFNAPPEYAYDIVPGEPDRSIIVYRMESTEPDVKMPELPSQLSDDDGVALIRAWIAAMPPMPCE